jgi:hypothetical protein
MLTNSRSPASPLRFVDLCDANPLYSRPVAIEVVLTGSVLHVLGEDAQELRFLGFLWTFLEGRANYYRFLRTLHYSLQFVLL